MISPEKFFGGWHAQTFPGSGVLTIARRFAMGWTLKAGGSGAVAFMEDPSLAYLGLGGGESVHIWNAGSIAFAIKSHASVTLVAAIAAGEWYEMILGGSGANAWAQSSLAWMPRKRLKL